MEGGFPKASLEIISLDLLSFSVLYSSWSSFLLLSRIIEMGTKRL
jgi:hypothetical protein